MKEKAFQILDQPYFPSDTDLLDNKFDFSVCRSVHPDIDEDGVWLRGFAIYQNDNKVYYGRYEKYTVEILARAFQTICNKFGYKFVLLIDSGRIEL